MNNIAKYSEAKLVHLSLIKGKDTIELTIKDAGVGFDPERSRKGLGLASMKERTELSEGLFSIHSVSGKGTVVRATWKVRVKPR
jgi:signal transduction histidine kinase